VTPEPNITTWTLVIAVIVLGAIALVVYATRSDSYADTQAEWYSNGHCFICHRPLTSGDDIGSYRDNPALGLAHFACIQAAEGPLTRAG
jgi:hypothetical protein